MKRWWLPSTPDLLGLLVKQGAVTTEGTAAFLQWSGGDPSKALEVRDIEHRADQIRKQLERELKQAFSTPIDAEDIYELSERLDSVLNAAKNTVREAEVMAMEPDAHMAVMAAKIDEGVHSLCVALGNLTGDTDRATEAADAAIKAQRSLEREYRLAMSSLLETEDLREVMGRRELYRRYARIGDSVVRAAERVWYAIVKVG